MLSTSSSRLAVTSLLTARLPRVCFTRFISTSAARPLLTSREPATEASIPQPLRPLQTKLYINGEFVSSSNNGTFETLCPANSSVLAHVSEATPQDVDAAVSAAKHAYEKKWSNINARERGRFHGTIKPQTPKGSWRV